MNFSCFKPPSLWSFVLQQPQEANTPRKTQSEAEVYNAGWGSELQCICNTGPWLYQVAVNAMKNAKQIKEMERSSGAALGRGGRETSLLRGGVISQCRQE